MTFDSDPVRAKSSTDGKGSILKDSKIGAVLTGLLLTVLLYVGQALGQIDVTPLPDLLEPGATGLLTGLSMWFITKAAPRH